jgi:phosphatidylserine/phosphatidylglycerophosphate/cardiolipin synthase-like enzyme
LSDIIYLKDREYLNALQVDMQNASIAHLSTVRLTSSVDRFFLDFISRGGKLYVVTNSVTRFPSNLTAVCEASQKLHSIGAYVAHYNTPYLLHSKLLTFDPDIVYIGSHNFTGQSLAKNIERSLRIENRQLYNQIVADIRKQGRWTL